MTHRFVRAAIVAAWREPRVPSEHLKRECREIGDVRSGSTINGPADAGAKADAIIGARTSLSMVFGIATS